MRTVLERRIVRILLRCSIVLIPILAAVVIPWVSAGATIFDATPLRNAEFGNDEVYYWHQTSTYVAQGFEGGYYAFGELAAKASWSHFDLHGPAHPVFFGTLGKVLGGWEFWTPMVINVGLLTISLAFFVAVAPMDGRKLALVLAVFLTAAPIWIYLISGMQESLHAAIAIVLAGVFIRMLQDYENPRVLPRVVAVVVLVGASLFRPTWSLLFIPFFMLLWKDGNRRGLVRSCLFGAIPVGILFGLYNYMGSKFPYGFVYELGKEPNLYRKAGMFIQNVRFNYDMLMHPLGSREWVEWLQHLQLVFFGIALVCYLVMRKGVMQDRIAVLTALLIIVLPEIIVMTLYGVGDWRDFRVMAPHLLLAILIVVVAVQTKFGEYAAISISLVALVFIPGIVISFGHWNEGRYNPDMRSYRAFESALQDAEVVHVEGADPWCNTILWRSRINLMPNEIIMFPRGMGMSFVVRGTIRFEPKSGWYLSDQRPFKMIKNAPWMKRIKHTEFGWIYKNFGSGCWRAGIKNTPVSQPPVEPVPASVADRGREWWIDPDRKK